MNEGPKAGAAALDPQSSTGYLVRDTHLAFVKALRARLQPYDMTPGQYFFLRALWIEEGLSQRALSRRVGTTEPTTASALRLLEKKGLIERVRNRVDRRTINIFLTAAGRALRDELLAHAGAINREAAAGIDDDEIARLHATLRRLGANLADGGEG